MSYPGTEVTGILQINTDLITAQKSETWGHGATLPSR